MAKALEMDMTRGPLFKKIVVYSIPLIFTNILQILFNAADVFVVGIFVDDLAVAAVGANSALINLIISVFVGLSVGTNVLVAKFIGENNQEEVRRHVGMTLIVSAVTGAILLVVGVVFGRVFLEWTKCDPDVIDLAEKYLRIYFYGVPIVILYNFTSAILRAAGDTVRPLIFLLIGGVVNIGLNIFFVTVLNMSVEGVAISTVVSEGISAVLSLFALAKNNGMVKLELKYIKVFWKELKDMMVVGIPSGIQGSLFSLANVLIQSSVNTLGSNAMSGYSYEIQISNVVFVTMNSVALTCMSFVGQNFGARKIDRIKRTLKLSSAYIAVLGIIVGIIATFVGPWIIGFITDDKEVVWYCQEILYYVSIPYFTCGIMDALLYSMRAVGRSLSAMLIALFGACIFRIIWINIFFTKFKTVMSIFISYPLSWVLTGIIAMCFLIFEIKKLEKTQTFTTDDGKNEDGENGEQCVSFPKNIKSVSH